MLSGRRWKDYAAESAAQALETRAEVLGIASAGPGEPDADPVADESIAPASEQELVAA